MDGYKPSSITDTTDTDTTDTDTTEPPPQQLNQEQADMEQYFQDVTGQAFASTSPQDRALMDAQVKAQEKAELKRQQRIADIKQQIDEAKEDFEKKIKRTTGPNSILYKQYENEYNSKLDFLRKKIQKEFKASPISRQATTGVEYELSLEDSVNANIKN
jgi:acyl-CoA reductase-like NAD-dependent aldehyde dehydrogenase